MNLPELQYLHISGSTTLTDNVIDGIAKCTKLTHLNLSHTRLTDKSIEALAKNWSNMTALNLRLLPITEKSVEIICQHCPELQSLNLILCNKVPATVCKLIQEGLPKLKELKVPLHWIDTTMLAQLKAARPDITYVEKSELIDAQILSSWYPAVILNESTTNRYLVHCYGYEDDNCRPMDWMKTDSSGLAPIFTHKDHYGKQGETHFASPCVCEILHPLCEHFNFGGSKNIAFINDWFFDTNEGKQIINTIATQIKTTGKLELSVNFPYGLSHEKAMTAALKSIPQQDLRHIVFHDVVSPNALQEMLTDKPSLLSLFFIGAFSDEHMNVVATKCNTLVSLSLFVCDVTSAGLENLATKITTLNALNIKECKNVTDKGLEALLLANNALDTVEIDFQYQLTGASVRLLGKLPQLQTAVLCHKLGHKAILDETNALKKTKPSLKLLRGEILMDYVNEYDEWHPAVASEFDEVKKKFRVHFFGLPQTLNDKWVTESESQSRSAEIFTHTTYGSFSLLDDNCVPCKRMHSLCKRFVFGGTHYRHLLQNFADTRMGRTV